MENAASYLSFEIDGRLFAFEAKNVVEVLINQHINPI